MSVQDQVIPVIQSVSPLQGRYDAWLCDVWGVIHNGEAPHHSAAEACRRFREQGGVVVLISNSPRTGKAVEAQMIQIGVPDGIHDAIVTSGDTTRHVLSQREDTPVFHLGPARDKSIFEGLDINKVELGDAGYVLCSGLYDDLSETPDDYRELLGDMKTRDLEMVCANPDLMVERGNRLIYCAGALAQAYAELGGRVLYTGKPHRPIYDRARELIEESKGEAVSDTRILCIGDGLKTDIEGARVAGLDALFIASGLHFSSESTSGNIDQNELEEMFAEGASRPVAAMSALNW